MLCFSPAFAQEKITFPVAASTKTAGYTPLWAALRQGFFAQQGLDVQPIVIRGSDRAIQALVGGSVYASVLAPDAPMVAADRGLDAFILAGNTQRRAHWIMGGKNYKTFDDLRGATLGTISLTAGTGLFLRHVLKAKGLEYPRDYKLLVIGGTPQTYAALLSGQIDAAALSLPVNYAAEEAGFNEIGKFVDVIPNYQLAAFSLKRSWGEKNRPVVIRFSKAMAQTMRWIYQNKQAAVDFLAKEMNLKPDHARRGWEFYTGSGMWHPDGDINLDGLQVVSQIYAEQTQAKGPVPNAVKYVDQSYLREALKE